MLSPAGSSRWNDGTMSFPTTGPVAELSVPTAASQVAAPKAQRRSVSSNAAGTYAEACVGGVLERRYSM